MNHEPTIRITMENDGNEDRIIEMDRGALRWLKVAGKWIIVIVILCLIAMITLTIAVLQNVVPVSP